MTRENPIQKACNCVGGQAALARVLGVTPAMVHQWMHGIRQVSAERCPAIERATQGAVRCEDLRPDVDWAVLRGSCPDEAAQDERHPTDHETQESA